MQLHIDIKITCMLFHKLLNLDFRKCQTFAGYAFWYWKHRHNGSIYIIVWKIFVLIYMFVYTTWKNNWWNHLPYVICPRGANGHAIDLAAHLQHISMMMHHVWALLCFVVTWLLISPISFRVTAPHRGNHVIGSAINVQDMNVDGLALSASRPTVGTSLSGILYRIFTMLLWLLMIFNTLFLLKWEKLTYCGLVMPHGDIDLSQHLFRYLNQSWLIINKVRVRGRSQGDLMSMTRDLCKMYLR